MSDAADAGRAERSALSFVGLANYAALARDPVFWRSLVNTCVYAVVVVPVSVALGLGVALPIEAGTSLRTFYRAVLFLPVTSTLIAGPGRAASAARARAHR